MSEENDARLILLAAKAAGLKVQYSNNCGDFSIGEPYSRGEVRWNPMDDDGDAFRLAVKLGMNVEVNDNYVLACTYGNFSEPSSPDQLAAARRAITRAAAAMASNGETV